MTLKAFVSVFQFEDYKKYVRAHVDGLSKQGRGFYVQASEKLRIHPVSLSQVFSGERNLTEDQGLALCEMLGLSEIETEYFILLVRIERAGTSALKSRLIQQSKKIKVEAQSLKNRLEKDTELDEKSKAVFYSNWFFSATRLLSGIEGYQSIEKIAEHLKLDRSIVRKVVEFLLRYQLCVEKDGKIKMGPSRTHLESDSIYISRHHVNWRLKAIESMKQIPEEHLHYTGPMVLSHEVFKEVRMELIGMIESVNRKILPSKNEKLACLSLDWFQI